MVKKKRPGGAFAFATRATRAVVFGPKFGTRSGGLTPVWVLGDVERSTPSLEIVVTDAAQADIAIRIPRIRIRVETTRAAVHAVAPIAPAYERTPISVVHATSKPRQT